MKKRCLGSTFAIQPRNLVKFQDCEKIHEVAVDAFFFVSRIATQTLPSRAHVTLEPKPKAEVRPNVAAGLILIGSELVSFAIFGVVLDYFLHSQPWFTVVFTLLGVVMAGWHGLKLLLNDEAKK